METFYIFVIGLLIGTVIGAVLYKQHGPPKKIFDVQKTWVVGETYLIDGYEWELITRKHDSRYKTENLTLDFERPEK